MNRFPNPVTFALAAVADFAPIPLAKRDPRKLHGGWNNKRARKSPRNKPEIREKNRRARAARRANR